MAIGRFYIPILGDFSSKGIIISDSEYEDPNSIPRNPDPRFQGAPRPGVLKWLFNITDDTTVPNHEGFVVDVPTPFVFTQQDVDTRLNKLLPIVEITYDWSRLSLTIPLVFPMTPFVIHKVDADVAKQRVKLIIIGQSIAQPYSVDVLVDFSHSAIN